MTDPKILLNNILLRAKLRVIFNDLMKDKYCQRCEEKKVKLEFSIRPDVCDDCMKKLSLDEKNYLDRVNGGILK